MVWFGLQIQCIPKRGEIQSKHKWMLKKFEEFQKMIITKSLRQFHSVGLSSLSGMGRMKLIMRGNAQTLGLP